MASNRTIVEKADFDNSDLVTAGLLNPEQANRFVRKLIEEPTLLRDVRVVEMNSLAVARESIPHGHNRFPAIRIHLFAPGLRTENRSDLTATRRHFEQPAVARGDDDSVVFRPRKPAYRKHRVRQRCHRRWLSALPGDVPQFVFGGVSYPFTIRRPNRLGGVVGSRQLARFKLVHLANPEPSVG